MSVAEKPARQCKRCGHPMPGSLCANCGYHGRGRPPGARNKTPSVTAIREAAREPKIRRRGKKNREANKPAHAQIIMAEVVKDGERFGEREFQRRRDEEKRQREDERQNGDTNGQFSIPYPLMSGRKKMLELSEGLLWRLWAYALDQNTIGEAAARLGCSAPTLHKFMKEYPQARDVWEDGLLNGRGSLRSQAVAAARAGNTPIMRHLLNTILGWSDKTFGSVSPDQLPEAVRSFEPEALSPEQRIALRQLLTHVPQPDAAPAE